MFASQENIAICQEGLLQCPVQSGHFHFPPLSTKTWWYKHGDVNLFKLPLGI